jgi:hypothetical protein
VNTVSSTAQLTVRINNHCVTGKDKTWRVLTYSSRNAMITYLEFTDVIDVPFCLMCNSGFRGSAMICLETIQFFLHALQCHLQGEFKAGGGSSPMCTSRGESNGGVERGDILKKKKKRNVVKGKGLKKNGGPILHTFCICICD